MAAPKSRRRRVAKRRSFWRGTRSLRGGRSPKPGGRGTRVLNAEPQGAAFTPKRWPSERANRRSCKAANLTLAGFRNQSRLQLKMVNTRALSAVRLALPQSNWRSRSPRIRRRAVMKSRKLANSSNDGSSGNCRSVQNFAKETFCRFASFDTQSDSAEPCLDWFSFASRCLKFKMLFQCLRSA